MEFDEENHITKCGDTIFFGGSGFKKHFQKPFDKERILSMMSLSYGIPEKVIADIWDGKREASALFGSAIHNALELRQNGKDYGYKDFIDSINVARNFLLKNGEVGKQISEIKYNREVEKALAKGKDKDTVEMEQNYAYPSHPTLARLVKEKDLEKELDLIIGKFLVFSNSLGLDGDLVNEPLVTYSPYKMGGFVDRLLVKDWDKKICRVGDYKVNVGSEKRTDKFTGEMDFLAPNKLSEYTIQTNFYAFCLIKAGWTVEGIDAFVFDNEEWKHYELQLFDMEWFEKVLKDKLI